MSDFHKPLIFFTPPTVAFRATVSDKLNVDVASSRSILVLGDVPPSARERVAKSAACVARRDFARVKNEE